MPRPDYRLLNRAQRMILLLRDADHAERHFHISATSRTATREAPSCRWCRPAASV